MKPTTKWDISLTVQKSNNGKSERLLISLPTALSAALIEAGMRRAKVEMTDDGLILRPYVAAAGKQGPVALPECWKRQP